MILSRKVVAALRLFVTHGGLNIMGFGGKIEGDEVN